MAKPVVFVIGATGNVGSATVQALSAKYADKVEIRAGVRNPDSEKAGKLKSIAGVSVVQAEMGAKDKLVATFAGVHSLFIVTPSTENRAQLTVATAEAAKDASVKYVVVVSVSTAELTNTIFGRQFSEIEVKIKDLGLNSYTFLRLPLFVESYLAFKEPIKGKSSVFAPGDPDKPFTTVVVEDAGKAAAAVLANPEKHANKTYKIVSDRHSMGGVAKAFSEALGKEVKFVQVPYDGAKRSFMQMGLPEWQVDGILELYKLIDNSSPVTNEADLSHYEQITGEKPTTLKAWVAKFEGAFK